MSTLAVQERAVGRTPRPAVSLPPAPELAELVLVCGGCDQPLAVDLAAGDLFYCSKKREALPVKLAIKIGGGALEGPQPRVVSRARPEPTRKGGSTPSPMHHCPWCGYAIRGLVPACPGCIDLEAALHENTEPGVTFHGAAPGSDRNGA